MYIQTGQTLIIIHYVSIALRVIHLDTAMQQVQQRYINASGGIGNALRLTSVAS